MVTTSSAKILIGISLDPNDSNELLSWGINVLAHSNDTIVAIHLLVGGQNNTGRLSNKQQAKFRRAKADVISVLGEFSSVCQSKQVNLEARVAFSSSVKRGLIVEAMLISADYILLRGLGKRLKGMRTSLEVMRYCLKHAPEGCTVVSVGIHGQPKQDSDSHSENLTGLKTEEAEPSPRTVLNGHESESNSTENDTSSSADSSMTESPSLPLEFKTRSNIRKPSSLQKFLSIFFLSPLTKRIGSLSEKEKQHSLLTCFSYKEILNATDNFNPDKMVGRGGYSEVYRGDLADGRSVAVKRLAKDNKDENKEKEFLIELGIIGHVNHPNTATLVGCCIENGLYLIFNLSENGNLASALHSKTSNLLEWEVRYKIMIGVAKGLHYLHKCCKHRIIHRDIKASNVLLGQDYEAKITDFGLSKWLPNKWTHHAVIPIEGTFGYLAPEYFMHGIVDEKTDVFAFGVLLLEIISGRRPVDSSKQNILHWAKPLMENGEIEELVDPKLEGKYNKDQLRRVVLTASYCVRQSSMWRPSMIEVLELLTNVHDSEVAKSWRIPNFTSHDIDDYSLLLGYEEEVPSNFVLAQY